MKIFLFVFTTLLVSLEARANERPNIILILVDDLGYGETGFNGQKLIQTPHLDQMAAEGAVFQQFYAAAPVCGPSRASLLLGMHTGRSPIRGNPSWGLVRTAADLQEQHTTFPEILQKAGYRNSVIGKWGMNENPETGTGHPFKQGFDEFLGFNTHIEAHFHYPDFYWEGEEKILLSETPGDNWEKKTTYIDDIFAQSAVEFVKREARTTAPFLLYLNLTVPHKGYTAPEDSIAPYQGKGWPERKLSSNHYEMEPDINPAYAGMVTRMDQHVGQVLDAVKLAGIAEETLIFFTSDNGHEYPGELFDSNGPWRGSKRDLYEGGIRMPTVAVWPGVLKPGSIISEPLAFWDILPTFCELAGVTELPSEISGLSFVPSLIGTPQAQKSHDYFYWEFNEGRGPWQALRFGDWKAHRQWDNKSNAMGAITLYNLATDPSEQHNLAGQEPTVISQAQKLFAEARSPSDNFPLTKRKPIKWHKIPVGEGPGEE